MILAVLSKCLVIYGYDRANANLGFVDLRLVDNLCVGNHFAKLIDSRVDFSLLLLSLIILAVLGQVTERTRGGNLLLILLYLYVYKVVKLILERFEACLSVGLGFCQF